MASHLQYLDVLGAGASRELLQLAVGQRHLFTASRTSPSKHYPDWRRSSVIYDDSFRGHAAGIESAVRARLPDVLPALGVPPFKIESLEIQLTSHNDGQYYRWHTDNSTPQTAARVVTFIYYFSADPRPFNGGELVIHGTEAALVEPINDSMVFFASSTRHEVKTVVCPSGRFEDGRFTINGWVRGRTRRPLANAGYFDQKIFGPLRLDAGPHPPLGPAVRPEAPEPSRSDAIVQMLAQLHRQSKHAARIAECTAISRDEFVDQYYTTNRPLVMRAVGAGSPAVLNWTPESLAARHGDVLIECTSGRDRSPDYELHYPDTVTTMTLAEFVAKMREPGSGDRLYLVARNHFFDRHEVALLRDELRPPPEVVDTKERGYGSVKLWMGGTGTVTPLHHDEHSIFFMQIYGRKRMKVIPPMDHPKLYVRARFYSEVDPERPDLARYPLFAEASMTDVELGPGDALFIPAGWWHHVRSLQPSISATFSAFHVKGGNTRLRTPR